MNFVNYGIDLGTTNSLIAHFEGGSVQVFKNPVGHKETLASVVAFRGGRTLVGDKAREYISKDPANVFASFKRKMGTGESFLVPSIGSFVTPIELSAKVLRELKNFVHTGDEIPSVVITIPASFDTVQSNATKKAGYEAGFGEVLLLQEPIAASLAYFNESRKDMPDRGHWLVYDLGGGTFDVALVSIANGELKVADHEGNNFLGGVDFDTLIIQELIVPQIAAITGDDSIGEQLLNRAGALEKLFYVLLYKAEEAKKELSLRDETEIEFSLPGHDDDIVVRITRNDFDRIVEEKILSTTALIRTMMKRNGLEASAISRIIMVGGSTFIPHVRELVARETGIPLAFDADPTTAVAVGAAYYAGSRLSSVQPEAAEEKVQEKSSGALRIKAVYQTVSSEEEELFMALPEDDLSGLSFRITRDDGGYDSGLLPVGRRISEFLPLRKMTLNRFVLRFFNDKGDRVEVNVPPIEIMQGKFNVAGQPLPNDICLEVDDLEANATRLQVLFERNDILPLKRTVYKEVTRTMTKGSDEVLVINVLEGSRHSRPHSNLVIGVIEIRGKDLTADLVKGSDIELRFEMSESRDLSIHVYLAMTEQEFQNVFSTSEKYVSVARLRDDMNGLLQEMRTELRAERDRDDENEWLNELSACMIEAEKLNTRLQKMKDSDLTDARYEISEARRRLSARYDELGRDQRLITLQSDYFIEKSFVEEELPHVDINRDRLALDFDRIVADEQSFLRARSGAVLRTKIEALRSLRNWIYSNTRHHIINIFMNLSTYDLEEFTKPKVAKALIAQGENALANEKFEELRSIAINLSHLLPSDRGAEKIKIKGTGIG